MRKFVLIFLVAVIMAGLTATAVAGQDSRWVMNREEITDLVVKAYKIPGTKILLPDDPKKKGLRVVFVYEGKQYTLDHDNSYTDGIQIWVRPVGIYSPDVMADCLVDEDMNGIVDFGTDGCARIFADNDFYYDGSVAEGVEYQAYWQNVYGDALTGLASIVYQ